jgi:hypothetical protein
MFIQVMRGKCSDKAALKGRMDDWEANLRPGADGYLGTTAGVTDDGTFIGVVRFGSRAQADANSHRPEQDAWWSETAGLFDGEVAFADYDDAITWLAGGSNDAGFVQVMQGTVGDAAAFRKFAEQPMDGLQEMRPEIIGGTSGISDDGHFTQTVYFTSEAAAREGEQTEMPAEAQAQMEAMGDMADVAFYDLRDPWLA